MPCGLTNNLPEFNPLIIGTKNFGPNNSKRT